MFVPSAAITEWALKFQGEKATDPAYRLDIHSHFQPRISLRTGDPIGEVSLEDARFGLGEKFLKKVAEVNEAMKSGKFGPTYASGLMKILGLTRHTKEFFEFAAAFLQEYFAYVDQRKSEEE